MPADEFFNLAVRHCKLFYGVKIERLSVKAHHSEAFAKLRSNATSSKFFERLSPTYAWQYYQYLYFFSRELYLSGLEALATLLYNVNKTLHGSDLFYQVDLKLPFSVAHMQGAVLANVRYGSSFVFFQSCTVGRVGEDRPVIGNGVVMYPNSMILGRSRVGNNVVLSAGVRVINQQVPSDCICFESKGGGLQFKEISELYYERYISPC